jgi:hypothetical protein
MAVTASSQITVLASAARTASVNSSDFTNPGARGVRVWIKVTAISATPSVVFTIAGKSSQGDYYAILASAAVTGTGTTTLVVHPDIAASANAVANTVLPYQWRVQAVAGDADSMTYSIGAEYLF